MAILTDQRPEIADVDRGYKGHPEPHACESADAATRSVRSAAEDETRRSLTDSGRPKMERAHSPSTAMGTAKLAWAVTYQPSA